MNSKPVNPERSPIIYKLLESPGCKLPLDGNFRTLEITCKLKVVRANYKGHECFVNLPVSERYCIIEMHSHLR